MAYTIEDLRSEGTLRLGVRLDLEKWARTALPPEQQPAAHHRLLIGELNDVCHGKTDRLMVLMPPGSAKSTYSSVLFPPWWFSRQRGSCVISATHTAALAQDFGARVRNLIGEHGRKFGFVLSSQKARHDFRLSDGGSYFATGVHGAVTGRRADLILIDDPVRSHEDADSPVRRDHLWNWYRSDLLTRLKPSGRIVLIMTRWHEDDLGGRLLQSSDGWRCIKLPALAGPDDPLGRAEGAALWPEWEDAAMLARKRNVIGERPWASLYQQEPRPQGDAMFRTEPVRTVDEADNLRSVRAWDLAATAAESGTDPDWTVGLKLGRGGNGSYVVQDVVRIRGSPLEVETLILRTADHDGPNVPISLPQDPGQAGKSQAQYLISRLAGFRVTASPENGSKTGRAIPVASQVEAGNVALLRGPWNYAFMEEMRAFPFGRKDDQIDALSRAFDQLMILQPAARRLPYGHMAR